MNRSNAHWRWTRRLGDALLLTVFAVPFADTAGAQPTRHGGDAMSGDATNDDSALPAADIDDETHGETLYLEVVLNHTRQPQLVRFVRRTGRDRDSRFFVHSDDLRRLGFVLADRKDDGMLALDELAGVEVRYDVASQRIAIDAPLSQLSLATTVLNVPDGLAAPVTATSPGLLFNYDLYASHDDRGSSQLSVASELRLFGVGPGVFSTSTVSRTYRTGGDDEQDGWRGDTVRLDSRWQLSFPETALTLSVGDTFSGFLNWTRPVRMGGVQLGRNFSLQPYRVTAPLPAFLGEVAVPSAVDLYVNGIRQYSGELPTGPFQLTTVPGISGAGNAQLVITDAFGRTRSLDFPFYSTQQLLARGLSDWSVSIGTVREDYGVESFSYASEAVASGNLRYGVSDRFTLESHAETGDGLVNAGLGGVWLAGRAGVVSASHARSVLDDERGSQTTLGYSWNNGRFNISADSQRTHGDYRDIASLYGARAPTVSERALAGFTTPALGNISFSYVRLSHPDVDMDLATMRYAGVFWTRNFARGWSANLSYNQNLDDDRDRSLYLSVTVPLDHDRQFGTSWQRSNRRDNGLVELAQPVPGDGGFGWRVQVRDGDDGSGGLAEAGWLGDHSRLGLGIASIGGARHGHAQASGGLVWMGGHAFAARRIDDAFAVVSTDGIAGVPVKLENRLIGHTDADGMLLVTPLNAWQRNKLSIDPMALPIDVRIADVDLTATPSDRAGTRVLFSLTPVRAALVVLHDVDGQPLPPHSRVRLQGTDIETIVGYDGEAYLDALESHNRLRVLTPTGACQVDFDYPEAAGAIPRIGPLQCLQETPP
nr:fimbria/pilus outer membrane usher protein [Lysobacter alkalisoli]